MGCSQRIDVPNDSKCGSVDILRKVQQVGVVGEDENLFAGTRRVTPNLFRCNHRASDNQVVNPDLAIFVQRASQYFN
jgi:hypothetical protein